MPEDNQIPAKRAASTRDYQRAYKACIPCRNRKARCDLGDRDGPPCVRCRREQRECIFSAERAWSSKRQKGDRSPTHEYQSHTGGQSTPGSYAENASFTASPRQPAFSRSNGHPSNSELTDSMIRTVVSSGNDALQILFEAAAQSEAMSPSHGSNQPPDVERSADGMKSAQKQGQLLNHVPPAGRSSSQLAKTTEPLKSWNSCRFVRNGLLTAEEAVTLVDLFFTNLSPMSPILTDYYSNHDTHRYLLTQEPLLCTTILMISSRYHPLPGPGGASRSFLIHDRLWQHCRHLIMKIMFGLEKGPAPKTRTVGTVEALLLLVDWHPRSLHFPSETDGWDADLMVTTSDDGTNDAADTPTAKWLEEVTEPSRRSDQMIWMLVGAAVTLAYELNLFDEETKSTGGKLDINAPERRRASLVKILYIFSTQIASRLGFASMFPAHRAHSIAGRKSGLTDEWDTFMLAWIELTRFIKSSSEMVFPSQSITKQLLQSGRYVSLLEHFRPLLEEWRRTYLGSMEGSNMLHEILFIDYQYVRVFCNSIGMQAVCERALSSSGSDLELREGFITSESTDYCYIQEVIDGSCEILQKVISLARKDALRFAPVRVFLRITTSSIFLLKAVSLGVRTGQLQTALELLTQSIESLRSSAPDDLHLASPYATLLELHVNRLKRRFSAVTKQTIPNPPAAAVAASSSEHSAQARGNYNNYNNALEMQHTADGIKDTTTTTQWPQQQGYMTNGFDDSMQGLQGLSADDWLSLPFDPSMAPFGPFGDDMFDNNTLDFLWNSPG